MHQCRNKRRCEGWLVHVLSLGKDRTSSFSVKEPLAILLHTRPASKQRSHTVTIALLAMGVDLCVCRAVPTVEP